MARKASKRTASRMDQLRKRFEEIRKTPPRGTKFDPGFHEGLPMEFYQSIDAVNQSSLKPALVSMAHWRYQPPPGDSEEAHFQIGDLVHHGHLEPAIFKRRYVVMPPFEKDLKRDDGTPYANPKATNAYKDLVRNFKTKHPDKQVVPQAWYDDALGMLNALNKHKIAQHLFSDGSPEVTMLWYFGDVLCKGRIDWLHDQTILVDLKTTIDLFNFHNNWVKYGYHWQAAMYCQGFKTLTGNVPDEYWIVAVEKKPPYAVLAAQPSPEALTVASSEVDFLLTQIHQAKKRRRYMGPSNPNHWELPSFYKPLDFQRFYG